MATPQTTGYNADTSKHLLLDAGAYYINYGTAQEKLLGATQGGGDFKATATFRQIQIDGIRGTAKGLKSIDTWEVSISANMLEVTPETIKLALGVADIDTTTDVDNDIITGRTKILDTDYIDNVAWVGVLSGSETPVVIQVFNALSEAGLSLSTKDGAEGVIPLQFIGHFGATDLSTPPFEISYPKLT